MSMGMEIGIFLAYGSVLLTIYVFGRFMLIPLKYIGLWMACSVLGGVGILVINYFGVQYGIFIPLNIWTAVIAGVLGFPGMVLLAVFFCI